MTARACLLAVVLVIASACETASVAAPPTLVIASDLPVSGQPASVGPLQQAIQLAIAQHSRIGAFRLKYLPLDDSLGLIPSTALGVQNVKRMIADPQVMGMVGPYVSFVIRDEIARAGLANLVMLSPTSTSICLTLPPYCDARLKALRESRPNNFFRIAAPDSKQGTAMARVAASLNIERVAAFNEGGEEGSQYLDHFGDELASQGGRLVWREDLPDGTTKFTAFLAKAKAMGAQAIYAVGGFDSGICQARVQMKNDFAYFFVTDAATETPCGTEPDSSAATYGTEGWVDPTHSSDPAVMTVVNAYRAAYPKPKEIVQYTFAAYDCALILIQAIQRVVDANGGGAPTRAQVLAAVAHGTFNDAVTGHYSFDAYGDAISPTMSVWKVQGGQWVYIKQIDVSPRPT
jgi:ABC-type branched-subunit amino acid transport system substrate-binding protein